VSAVAVRGLTKSYGTTEALRGIDFTIEAGEVFGLLGPNGAGKTTTVEILEGYRERSGGARGASRSASCCRAARSTPT
jgi:ABC-2 type transport system ATP-binding protein